ncbi:MAG: hypothetical protein K0S44_530 [Bacteroidetes bacterium]|jgi:hypothetical protein|nr:hypothetical protein [Bacteroidota bacterium]
MKKITILLILLGFAFGFKYLNSASSKIISPKYHTSEQIEAYQDTLTRAPIAAGQYFLPSSSCRDCHGFDSTQSSSVDEAGNDVNLVDRWESTMMALSSKDPFWKAKVRQEIMINPGHAGDLQNRCLDCHAPLGSYTSKYHGQPFYGLSDLASDTLGKDGVSCAACHAIGPNGLGTGSFYSGNIPYDTNRVEYGPFTSPFVGAMQLYEGLTPVYSPHMDNAKVCSSCHTLVTQTSDLSGAYTGGHFVEQATYHEYVNSSFPGNNISCQSCHMPQINEGIIIASSTAGLTPRSPFNQHTFQGANLFMLNLIKNNKDSLNVYVSNDKFDSTIVATSVMLQQKSIDLDIILDSVTIDTAFYRVKIRNKAGHKFPSGYPSRRAVLQMVITDGTNDTIFRSGIFNNQQRVIGENSSFEPHHAVISQSNKPQIYELIPGDVNGDFTSILERAAVVLKDNRIPPDGFTMASPVYDTTLISADAISDPDFNKTGMTEGSGTDYVIVHAPVTGAVGNLKIRAKMFYQAVPPKWVDQLFAMSAPEIDKFKAMYQGADQRPFLMVSDSIVNIGLTTGISEKLKGEIMVWPTVSVDGKVNIEAQYGDLIREVDVYTTDGKNPIHIINTSYRTQLTLELPPASGVYYLRIRTGYKTYFKKVVRS